MYLYLGGNKAIRDKSVIGIFDLDNTTVSKKTRDFLNNAEKEKQVAYTSYDLPKTFVLCQNKGKSEIYITAVTAQTIKKRAENKAEN